MDRIARPAPFPSVSSRTRLFQKTRRLSARKRLSAAARQQRARKRRHRSSFGRKRDRPVASLSRALGRTSQLRPRRNRREGRTPTLSPRRNEHLSHGRHSTTQRSDLRPPRAIRHSGTSERNPHRLTPSSGLSFGRRSFSRTRRRTVDPRTLPSPLLRRGRTPHDAPAFPRRKRGGRHRLRVRPLFETSENALSRAYARQADGRHHSLVGAKTPRVCRPTLEHFSF